METTCSYRACARAGSARRFLTMQRPTMLRIVDPTNPPSAVRERVMRALGDARAVQPLWASKPLRERLGVIREVRALIAERSQARITSYNVCYTKLLRNFTQKKD